MPIMHDSMTQAAERVLTGAGIDSKEAATLASAIATEVCSRHAEEIWRVPNLSEQDKAKRNDLIRAAFKGGTSTFDLSKRFSLSCQHIRRIVADQA